MFFPFAFSWNLPAIPVAGLIGIELAKIIELLKYLSSSDCKCRKNKTLK